MADGNNWSGGVAPADNTGWLFTNSSTTALTNNFADYTVDGITFTTNAPIYTFGGNAFALASGITNRSIVNQTISNALTINSAVIVTNTANSSAAYVTLRGALSGSGTLTYGALNAGARLQLYGSLTNFSGSLSATSGRINIGTGASAGAGVDFTFNNAGVYLEGSNTTYRLGSFSGSALITGNGTASTNNTLEVGAKNSNTTFSGTIGRIATNTAREINLRKIGTGTLTLSGSNNYAGITTISNGALVLAPGAFLSADTAVNVAAGTDNDAIFDISGISETSLTVASIASSARGIIVLGDKNLTVGGNDSSTTVGGITIGSGGSLTKVGAGMMQVSGTNTYSGGFTLNAGSLRPQGNATVTNGAVISGPVGTGTFTLNGGRIMPGGAGGLYANQYVFNADFAVNSGVASNANNGLLSLAGPIDLTAGTRTVSLGRWTNAAGVLTSGQESLRLFYNNGLTTTLSNGTLRVVRDASGSASDYVGLSLQISNFFPSGAGLVIGTNVITTMATGNPFGAVAGDQPHLTVEAGGYFNMSDSTNARSPQVRTLSGNGFVTSLANAGSAATATLTINAQSGDNATFSGQIVNGTSLNGALGTSAANIAVALTKSGAGTQTLNGTNTHSGNTTVNDGLLELGPDGVLTFYIGPSGTNNRITGLGSALLRGTFVFDLGDAATNVGAAWTIVSASTPRTYDGSFRVAGFTNTGGNWFRGENGVTYRFSPSNNVLAVTTNAPADPYTAWAGNFPGFSGTNAAPSADPDGDGFINQMEFAFGGNPTVGTPALLSTRSQAGNALFSFVADTNDFSYTVQSTSDLLTGPWTNNPTVTLSVSNATDQSGLVLSNYVRREFSVTPVGKTFFRIEAAPQP